LRENNNTAKTKNILAVLSLTSKIHSRELNLDAIIFDNFAIDEEKSKNYF